MSAALCICGHPETSHEVKVPGGTRSAECFHCACDRFMAQRATSEFPAAPVIAGPEAFGVPSALLPEPTAIHEAALQGALSCVTELRLLIASVDDVLCAPAPKLDAPRSPLSASDQETLHRLAIGRLALSQRNARQALGFLDNLRGEHELARRDLATLEQYAQGKRAASGPAALVPNVDGDGRE